MFICIHRGEGCEGWDNLFPYLFFSTFIWKTCLRSDISCVCNLSLSMGSSSGWFFHVSAQPKAQLWLNSSFLEERTDTLKVTAFCSPWCCPALRGSCSRVRSDTSHVLGSSCCSWCCGLRREVYVIIEMDLNFLIFFGSSFCDTEGLCFKIAEHDLLSI